MPNVVVIGLIGVAPEIGKMYGFDFFRFFRRRKDRTTVEPILTVDGSNDAVYSKDVPFGGHFDK